MAITINQYYRNKFGKKVFRIPVHAGFTCPNRDGSKGTGGCIYCNEKGSLAPFVDTQISVQEQLEMAMEKKKHRDCFFVAYFQSFTNTYGPVDTLRTLYEVPLGFEKIVGIAIGTRPDCLDSETISILRNVNKKTDLWVELGLQSSHNITLSAIGRGHTFEDFRNGFIQLREAGINICVHVILGLPGESRDMMMQTADRVARLKPEGIKFHHLHVLKDSALEKPYKNGEISLLKEEEYIHLVKDFIKKLPEKTVLFRLMGDAPRNDLLAPEWTRNKQEITKKIHLLIDKN